MRLMSVTFIQHTRAVKELMIGRKFMKNLRAIVALTLIPLAVSRPASASSGTEGASFLDIPVGAGPAALGSAYTALATNAYAPVWNPAGLAFLKGSELAAQHLSYIQAIRYEHVSCVIPLGRE